MLVSRTVVQVLVGHLALLRLIHKSLLGKLLKIIDSPEIFSLQNINITDPRTTDEGKTMDILHDHDHSEVSTISIQTSTSQIIPPSQTILPSQTIATRPTISLSHGITIYLTAYFIHF